MTGPSIAELLAAAAPTNPPDKPTSPPPGPPRNRPPTATRGGWRGGRQSGWQEYVDLWRQPTTLTHPLAVAVDDAVPDPRRLPGKHNEGWRQAWTAYNCTVGLAVPLAVVAVVAVLTVPLWAARHPLRMAVLSLLVLGVFWPWVAVGTVAAVVAVPLAVRAGRAWLERHSAPRVVVDTPTADAAEPAGEVGEVAESWRP
jgi:hypothetical protein